AIVYARLEVWAGAVFVGMWILRHLAIRPPAALAPTIALATAVLTVAAAAAAPFGTYLLLPSRWWGSRDSITAIFPWFGPPAAVLVGPLISAGLAVVVPHRQSKARP